MKKYLLDQIGTMTIILVLATALHFSTKNHKVLAMVLDVGLLIPYGYLCRRMLLLPLDLLFGKKTEILYFSRMSNIQEYELFSNQCCCLWQFYSSTGTVKLLVPASVPYSKILELDKPKTDQKVRICYYPYSKILYSWEAYK